MELVIVVLAAWCILPLPLAILVGRMLHGPRAHAAPLAAVRRMPVGESQTSRESGGPERRVG